MSDQQLESSLAQNRRILELLGRANPPSSSARYFLLDSSSVFSNIYAKDQLPHNPYTIQQKKGE
jgi:hypothetical protein